MKTQTWTDRNQLPVMLAPRALPETKALLAEMRQAVVDTSWFQDQMRANDELRLCWWAGQKADGRKHGTVDRPARPWENAADHRVHLVGEIMKERTEVRLRALKNTRVSLHGRGVEDKAKGALLKQVLDYYLKTLMKGEVEDEMEYFSNWSQSFGHAVMYCGWKTRRQIEERTVTVTQVQELWAERRAQERLMAAAETGEESAAEPVDEEALNEARMAAMEEALQLLETPEGQMLLAEVLTQADEDLQEAGRRGRAEALRAIKQLRVAEEAVYLAPYVLESRPTWEALMPMVDVIYPSETRKIQDARWVARIRWMNEVELLAWAEEEDLDPEWVKETRKHPGRCYDLQGVAEWVMGSGGTRFAARSTTGWTDSVNLRHWQVLEVYWRAVTPEGVEVLYRTIAHGKVQDRFGKHEVCKAYHGQQPFVELREEHHDKLLLSSRGVPEIVGTYQQAVKAQWDSRTDAASLATVPPLKGPAGSSPPPLGPGVYVESYRSGSVEWMQPPRPDDRSIEIERTIRSAADRYYGRMSPDVPEMVTVLVQQTLADRTLAAATRLITLTVQLIQQYTPDLEGARISGSEEYVSATRAEIQGMYDIETSWDARDLSLEWLEQKLKFYTDLLLPLDNQGIINRGQIIMTAAESVDPQMARRFVRAPDEAAARETEEEQAALSAIFSGGLPPFVQGGNHALRAQVMTEDAQQSPLRQQMLAGNEMIQRVWEDRLQKHLFQVEQEANKVAGRQGGSDPLRQSPLARLKAGGWQAVVNGNEGQSALGGSPNAEGTM